MATRGEHAYPDQVSEPTAWRGWVVFAAIMMVVVGTFNVVDGLVALLRRTWYLVGPNTVLVWNLTAWGWFWLISGAVVIGAGFGVLTGRLWARVVGIVLAGLNALGQLASASVYPVWS